MSISFAFHIKKKKMATILLKDLVRESTVCIGENAIVVTIKADQSVELKLKGIRGGDVLNISLLDLWLYLGGEGNVPKVKGQAVEMTKSEPKKGDNKMISLYDLRSENMISMLDYETKAKFDGLIHDMIKNLK